MGQREPEPRAAGASRGRGVALLEALEEPAAQLRRDAGPGVLDGEGDAALLSDIWAEAARDPVLAKALKARDEQARGRLAAAIDRARLKGAVYPALDSAAAAEMLIAALEGFALRRALWRDGDTSYAVTEYRTLALHLLKPKR